MSKLSGYEANRLLKKESKRRKGIQPVLESGVDVKTINGETIVGSGNLDVAGGGGYAEGTSFPGSPTTNQKFYRTDLNWLCFYDGTRWLTCQEFSEPIALAGKVFISVTPDASGYLSVRKDYQLYITTMTNSIRVSTTSNGSNFWDINLLRYNSASSTATVHTFNTSALTAGVYTDMKQTINAPLDSSAFFLSVEFAKTGSPGLLGIFSSLQYRLIVT